MFKPRVKLGVKYVKKNTKKKLKFTKFFSLIRKFFNQCKIVKKQKWYFNQNSLFVHIWHLPWKFIYVLFRIFTWQHFEYIIGNYDFYEVETKMYVLPNYFKSHCTCINKN